MTFTATTVRDLVPFTGPAGIAGTKIFLGEPKYTRNHKVLIFTEYYSVCPLVGIGTPPTPLQCAPPPEPKGGGAHSPAGAWVVGRSQFDDWGKS